METQFAPEKIDRKHLLTIFFPEDKNKTQLSLKRRAREVADDVFLTDFGDVIKVW